MNPSFILSSARTGSTLTRFIVDTHPEIFCPAELELGPLAASLYFSVATLAGRLDEPMAENPGVLARLRTILGGLMDEAARAREKRIWCEKSPANVRYRELLAAVFPEARFVCLYRHGLDVARSCLEASRHGFIPVLRDYVVRNPEDTVRAAVQYWVDDTAALLDFERSRPRRTLRLRYEDIVLTPATALGPLFEFLGVAWDPALLGSVFTERHDPGVGDGYVRYAGRIHRDSLGAGRNLPLKTLPAELRQRLLALLDELGYGAEPESPRAAEDVSGPAAGEPRWVFETLVPERLRAGRPPALKLSCVFAVQGPGGGVWSLDVGDGRCQVRQGGEAPSRIDLEAADLLDIVHGRVNALKLAREGRIRVSGPLSDEALRELILLIRTDLGGATGDPPSGA